MTPNLTPISPNPSGRIWQDPLVNFMGPYFTYNSWMLNMGSWMDKVPGVVWPSGNMLAEPILLNSTVYIWCLFGVVLLGNAFMRYIKRRQPTIGKLGLLVWCFAFMCAVDLFAELTMMRLGFWSYVNTISWLTVFPNEYYRFPIYECVVWSFTWTALAALRYFKNDKGQTLGERGVERVRCTPKQQGWLRFLGVFGAVNFIWLFVYTIPMQYFHVNADAPPKAIQERSYFISGICGEGTAHSCGGQGVPIPRRSSPSVDPEGRLQPGDTPPPAAVPLRR